MTACLDVTTTEQGALLTPTLRWGQRLIDPSKVMWVGRLARLVAFQAGYLGFSRDAALGITTPEDLVVLRLDPVAVDATMQLMMLDHMQIAEQHLPAFFAQHYPQLCHRLPVISSDGSVELPEISPPRLRMRASYEGEHQARVWWELANGLGDDQQQMQEAAHQAMAALQQAGISLDDLPGVGEDYLHQPSFSPTQHTGMGTVALAALLNQLAEVDALEVKTDGDWPDYRQLDELPRLELSVTDPEQGQQGAGSPRTDWFNLDVQVMVGSRSLAFHEVFTALSRYDEFLLLEDGSWIDLRTQQFEQLRLTIEQAQALRDPETGQMHLTSFLQGFGRSCKPPAWCASKARAGAGACRGFLTWRPSPTRRCLPPWMSRCVPTNSRGIAGCRCCGI